MIILIERPATEEERAEIREGYSFDPTIEVQFSSTVEESAKLTVDNLLNW